MSRAVPLARGAARVAAAGATAAALFLAVLRVTDPGQRRLIELTALVPAGLPLAVLGAVLAALAVRRRRRAVAALVPVALAVVHGWWLAPLFTGMPPAAQLPCSLTVVSQNLEFGDAAELGREATRLGADVLVVLQIDDERLAQLRSGAGDLAASVSVPTVPDVVVLTRVPVTEWADVPGHGVRRLRLVSPCLGPVDVVAAHPTQPVSPTQWAEDHTRLRSAVLQRPPDPGSAAAVPLVVVGDLNATRDHAPLRRLAEIGLRDAVEIANGGWRPTYPLGGTERRLGVPVPLIVPIDHVLISQGLTVSQADTFSIPGADHLGVVARIHPVRGA